MPRIHVLSEELANRIAAGEVVERPASVVKELVENAIDAGARRIEVELVDGGRQLIRVRDDGCGMTAEDAALAVQRFATSKIRQAEDLEAISTMGFRGEALPSIAAVSRLRIQTREAHETEGTEVIVEGGGPVRCAPVGCPTGTVVEVRDLFYNTPARAKFLATSARERGHCADWVTRLALARPDIAFKLTHDGEVIFTSTGSGDLRSVLAAIYGSSSAREFLPVHGASDGLTVQGLVSGPKLLRATREHQLFFVNQRFVRSRQIGHALNEAYGLLLPAGRHPLCALHISVAPHRVDPNVHPTKIEVRFRRPEQVHELVQRSVEAALAEAGFRSLTQTRRHVYLPRDESADSRGHPGEPRPLALAGRWDGPGSDDYRQARRLRINPFEDRVDARDEGLDVYTEPVVALTPPRTTAPLAVEPEPGRVQVLGQVGQRYLVAASVHGLLLIDQHRAEERVILERLQPARLVRQLLVTPETLQMSPLEAAVANENVALLVELGYDVEDFGGNALLVRAVPAATAHLQPVEILQELVAELAEWGAASGAERRAERARASLACHAATRAGQRLTLADMQRLVDDLLRSESPAVCPHGDPIIVTLDLNRLDREFKRG